MSAIMQGTTPELTITISPDDLLLSAVTAVELYIRNGGNVTTYTAADLTIDLDANTITKRFSEAETAALDPSKNLIVQGRLWAGDAVFGINKLTFSVADMEGVGNG